MKQDLPALTRLYELDGVSGVFLFNDEGKVLGCVVPRNYTEQTIGQVVRFLRGPIEQAQLANLGLKDLRVSYEYYTVWVKCFSNEYNLAVFIRAGANLSLLRQPINLSALNLEKALQRDHQPDEETAALMMAAHQAEMEMVESAGGGENIYFQRLADLAEMFLGPVAMELLHHALRQEQVTLPLGNRVDMEKLMRRLAQNVSNVQNKKAFLQETEDLLERLELDLQTAKSRGLENPLSAG